MASISKGTPGMEIKMVLLRSNHIPEAVPAELGNTVQLAGNSA